MPAKTHSYRVTTTWTGNLGPGTADYRSYSRNHEVVGDGKPALPCSSNTAFHGDPARYTPEDLLVASLSACHMLWLLHFCADEGIVVTEYVDEASGVMTEGAGGSGRFTSATLRPRIVITDPSRADDVVALNHKAHEYCFIAKSVNFPITVQPTISGTPPTA